MLYICSVVCRIYHVNIVISDWKYSKTELCLICTIAHIQYNPKYSWQNLMNGPSYIHQKRRHISFENQYFFKKSEPELCFSFTMIHIYSKIQNFIDTLPFVYIRKSVISPLKINILKKFNNQRPGRRYTID